MDAKVFRMALLTIFSAFILVLVIIYATNADKINSMFGRKKSSPDQVTAEASAQEVSILYGQQIGNDLNSFLYDEDFFDENEQIPAVVVIKKNSKSISGITEASNDMIDDENEGLGMAVAGQLDNPDAAASFDSFYVPPLIDTDEQPGNSQVVGGTPVGNVPAGN